MTYLNNLVSRIINDRYANDHTLAPVVTKSLLQDVLLFSLSNSNLLKHLVFHGGAALYKLYKSPRLSEDLNFICGYPTQLSLDDFVSFSNDFSKAVIRDMHEVYGLKNETISVHEPQNINSLYGQDIYAAQWTINVALAKDSEKKISVNIKVVNVPAHDVTIKSINKSSSFLRYHNYEIVPSILINVESEEELIIDKYVALISRDYINYEDLFDLKYLRDYNTLFNICRNTALFIQKLNDYRCDFSKIRENIKKKLNYLNEEDVILREFKKEMEKYIFKKCLDDLYSYNYVSEIIKNTKLALNNSEKIIEEHLTQNVA